MCWEIYKAVKGENSMDFDNAYEKTKKEIKKKLQLSIDEDTYKNILDIRNAFLTFINQKTRNE